MFHKICCAYDGLRGAWLALEAAFRLAQEQVSPLHILWGLGMGVHEAIVPAAVAGRVPANWRASAYGRFTAGYGLFWFLGSAAIGLLYNVSLLAVVAFSLIAELAAIPLFLLVRRQSALGGG